MRSGLVPAVVVLALVAPAVITTTRAQEPAPEMEKQPAEAGTASGSGESSADELSRRATDPTASPMTFSFIGTFTTDYYDFADGSAPDGTRSVLKLQPVIPFSTWGFDHKLRLTVPYQVGGPGEEGLGDVTLFDLVVLPRPWGRLGVGVVANFTSAAIDAPSNAAAGPAIGFVVPVSKKLNWGLFNQNLFADGIGISQLQPIVAYQLGNGWSLSGGDLQIVYDWERGEFVSVPIGVQLGKVTALAGQPMRFAVNPQYQFEDLPGADRFSVTLTVSLLVPGGG